MSPNTKALTTVTVVENTKTRTVTGNDTLTTIVETAWLA
jgi:hypothetical protein